MTMRILETDFAGFTLADRIRHFEVEGFVLLPDLIDGDTIGRLKEELEGIATLSPDYSDRQKVAESPPQWRSRTFAELIGHPRLIAFLTELLGDEIVFTRGTYTQTHPGYPGMALHTDGQPYGSSIFGYEGSPPALMRVLYYLDDLDPERAPLRVVPRSHLSFHADANPYLRYERHPNEVTICARAGSAVAFAVRLFHGVHPNRSDRPRSMAQFGYRPAWAGPIQPVEEWPPELVAAAPEAAIPFLADRNRTGFKWELENRPADMRSDARGIDPLRWGDGGPPVRIVEDSVAAAARSS